jgi:hypothetical protein
MLVYSDNNPQEFEFIQGGILVRWGVEQAKSNIVGGAWNGSDEPALIPGYQYQEVKVELTDTIDQIASKLTNAGYTNNVGDFADRIIAFRAN